MSGQQTARAIINAINDDLMDRGKQYICTSKLFCKCVGQFTDWDECSCFVDPAIKRCMGCNARMVLIDIESGEEV